jgi:acetylglutamate kinase
MIVIKYGGHAMTDDSLQYAFANEVVALQQSGKQPVVVHGGGPQIEAALEKLGIKSEFISGLRVTTPEIMDVVQQVLCGEVLRSVVNSINNAGAKAVGITGRDSNLITAIRKPKTIDGETVDLGLVGEIETVDPSLIKSLISGGYIPVIAPVSQDKTGIALNVNADIAAGAIAGALNAELALFLTDVSGLYRNWPDESSLISEISINEARELLPSLSAGMIPKITACLNAIDSGAVCARISDGRISGAITNAVSGTAGTLVYS